MGIVERVFSRQGIGVTLFVSGLFIGAYTILYMEEMLFTLGFFSGILIGAGMLLARGD